MEMSLGETGGLGAPFGSSWPRSWLLPGQLLLLPLGTGRATALRSSARLPSGCSGRVEHRAMPCLDNTHFGVCPPRLHADGTTPPRNPLQCSAVLSKTSSSLVPARASLSQLGPAPLQQPPAACPSSERPGSQQVCWLLTAPAAGRALQTQTGLRQTGDRQSLPHTAVSVS